MGVSGNLCSFLKESKPLVLYAVEHGIAMEPMKGKCASTRGDLGYTEQFYIPDVTAGFISSCEMKDEPEFKPLQGNWAFF